MKVKRYNVVLFLIISFFILINYLVWSFFTIRVLPQDGTIVGDLARMSYRSDIIDSRMSIDGIENKFFNYSDEHPEIDLIVIGDSFSNGGGGGRYYQDMIASTYNINVINLQPIGEANPIETVLVLLQTDEFQEWKPKYILLQSVERFTVERFSTEPNWNIGVNDHRIQSLFSREYIRNVPEQFFINIANFKYAVANLLYHFDDNAYISDAYIVDIKEELFTSASPSKLSFYFGDIDAVGLASDSSISNLNNQLNELSRILEEKGVKLIFMPTVDKLNLYGPYISDNRYPVSSFFEKLREEDQDYYFLDTKHVLSNALEAGVKDVYFSDGTHWSNMGRELVVKELGRVLD